MPLADRSSYRAIEGQTMRQRFQHRLREDVRTYIEVRIPGNADGVRCDTRPRSVTDGHLERLSREEAGGDLYGDP